MTNGGEENLRAETSKLKSTSCFGLFEMGYFYVSILVVAGKESML